MSDDTISRQAAIDSVDEFFKLYAINRTMSNITSIQDILRQLPSAQPELKYTKEELDVFRHGISLSLLSKRSSQHWRYDEDTAKEIEFLEKLYKKVVADMRGERDE